MATFDSSQELPLSQETNLRDLLRSPIEERRRILMQQAERLANYYEITADDRVEWQGGDIIE